jgi:RimJ/RimL family protein N-acetyltransferase
VSVGLSLDLPALITRRNRLIQFRRVAASDRGGLRIFLGQLSAQTRFLRYLVPIPAFTGLAAEREIARLLEEHPLRERLVAIDSETGAIVAVAELARHDTTPVVAEAALIVADAYQGEGIGRALAQHLFTLACSLGVTRIVATILPENRAVHALLAALGLTHHVTTRHGEAFLQVLL